MAKGGNQRRRLEAKREAERRARKKAGQRRRAMTSLVAAVLVILLVTGGMAIFSGSKENKTLAGNPSSSPTPTAAAPTGCPGAPKKPYKSAPPANATKAGVTYTATFETNKGEVVVELLTKEAPKSVNNFVFLARDGFYDNTVFHRVIPDFGGPGSNMIQGGDGAKCNGTGDPGYAFGDENLVPMTTSGLLAMANSGPKTNGSQFFLLDGPVSHLNAKGTCPGPQGCHSVFGKVTKGLDVIKAIATVAQDQSNRPLENVIIKTITITES